MDTIAIVGASLAGTTAAKTLRAEGFEGAINVVDAQPHRPYDRPPLSKQVVRGDWDVDRIGLVGLDDLDVTWRLGVPASALDAPTRRLTLADGDELVADGIVVATGARARTLPGTDGLAGVHVLRTVDDAMAVRRALDGGASRVVVIGAGFIGAEVAASCRERGAEVAMVEMAPVPLSRVLGDEVGATVADLHRDHGVDVRLGVGVDAVEAEGGSVRGVRLDGGEVLEADVVVVGIGVAPDTDWLEGSGLTLDDGVVCDAGLQAAPGIVAAGDLLRWPSTRYDALLRIEHWEHAIQSGEAAARRLLVGDGHAQAFDPIPWFWTDQFDRKLQLAGRTSPGDDVEIVEGSLEERRFVAVYGHDGRFVAVLGMNRPRHVVQLRALLEAGATFDEAVGAGRGL